MGHSSIKVTFDLYGHLMPGTEAAALLDSYLASSSRQGWKKDAWHPPFEADVPPCPFLP